MKAWLKRLVNRNVPPQTVQPRPQSAREFSNPSSTTPPPQTTKPIYACALRQAAGISLGDEIRQARGDHRRASTLRTPSSVPQYSCEVRHAAGVSLADEIRGTLQRRPYTPNTSRKQ